MQRRGDGSLSVKLADFGLCREFFEFEGVSPDSPSIFQRSLSRSLSGSARLSVDCSPLPPLKVEDQREENDKIFEDDLRSAELQNAIEIAAFSAGVEIPSELFDGDDMVGHPLSRKQTAHTVTPQYRAPEIYMSDGYYDQAVDVWSLGCILYDMLYFMRTNRVHSQNIANGILKQPQPIHLRHVMFCSKKLFAGLGEPPAQHLSPHLNPDVSL